MVTNDTIWEESIINETTSIRTFESCQLFEWHRDAEDRQLKVLEIEGHWEFIMDNAIPSLLSKGSIIMITAGYWHRLNSVDVGKISILIEKR